MTAAEWLDAATTSRTSLVTISNVRDTLQIWTRVGATQAYQIAWVSQTNPGAASSMYRRIDGVRVNHVDLTAVASLAAVEATLSSWFWDSATSTLYVATPGGVSPDTYSWVGATFSFFVATTTVTDVVLYEPRVTGTLPSLRQEEYNLTLGLSSSSDGNLTLLNADGCFDDVAWRYAWNGASVAIRVGGGAMLVADYLEAGMLQIVGAPAPKDDVCVFTLRAFDDQTRARVFPLNLYKDDESVKTSIDPAVSHLLGQFMPMFFGSVQDVPAFLMYKTIGAFGAHIGHFCFMDVIVDAAATVSVLRVVNRATNDVTELAYSATAGFLQINIDTYPPETYDFYVDAARSNAPTVGTIAMELLTLVGVPAASIDSAAFAAADAAWPATLSLYVPGGAAPDVFISAGELLRQVEQASLGRVSIGADGIWTIDLYDPSLPLDAPVLEEERITAFAADSDSSKVLAQSMRVQYGYKVRQQAWDTVTSSQAAAAYQYQTTEVLNFQTILREASYATVLADRLAWMNSRPTYRFVLDGPPVCFTLAPRDKVRVIRRRAPSPTGGWPDPGVGMEIEAVAARPSDCRAEATIGNMRGLGGAVKIAAPNGTAAWASASGLERLLYIFALDNSTQRADVADPTTYQQNRAW